MSASGGADCRRERQVPGRRPLRYPSRTMAYSVNKDLDHRKEYFWELTCKKWGQYDRGRARTQEPSGYKKTNKMIWHKTTLATPARGCGDDSWARWGRKKRAPPTSGQRQGFRPVWVKFRGRQVQRELPLKWYKVLERDLETAAALVLSGPTVECVRCWERSWSVVRLR